MRQVRPPYVDPCLEAIVRYATRFPICAFVTVLLVPGCRTGGPADARTIRATSQPEPTPRTSADVLGYVEMQSAPVNNAHEAVVRFRPEFLKRRADRSIGDPTESAPVVYLDGVRQGGTEMLNSIPVGSIVEIRYLTSIAASAQLGRYHPAGVIAVRTRR